MIVQIGAAGYGAFYAADKADPGPVTHHAFDHGWSADIAFSYYHQRSGWRLGGGGSGGLEPFSARWIMLGISKTF